MNNVLTASRMVTAMQCLRQQFFRYEIGLVRDETGLAQRMGTVWAKLMELRWKNYSYEKCIEVALTDCYLDELSIAIVSALFAGYCKYYNRKTDPIKKCYPEEQFGYDIGYNRFTAEGKLDGLVIMRDESTGIIEDKTTSDSIGEDSQYWLRLKFNMQVYQYIDASWHNGWEPSVFIYDVTRKPAIRPKEIQEVDEEGLVVVRSAQGERVRNSRTNEWKKTADKSKGETIATHTETPEEFYDRLLKDTIARPEFYFARKEVPILEEDVYRFQRQRLAIAKIIEACRKNEDELNGRQEAWPRNVLESTCTFCQYKSFCLQNHDIDINNPPEGFSIKPFNPELEQKITAQDDSSAD